MARREALLRLHKTLTGRRNDLRGKLSEELANMRSFERADSTGDAADAAFESGSDEMASQLAALDSRELHQIDRALARLKQGTYGLCEACQTKIPVARLNALPYTTLCIICQREMEQYPDWGGHEHGNWENVADANSSSEDREVSLASLEMDLAK